MGRGSPSGAGRNWTAKNLSTHYSGSTFTVGLIDIVGILQAVAVVTTTDIKRKKASLGTYQYVLVMATTRQSCASFARCSFHPSSHTPFGTTSSHRLSVSPRSMPPTTGGANSHQHHPATKVADTIVRARSWKTHLGSRGLELNRAVLPCVRPGRTWPRFHARGSR